jgi:protein CpxP
MNQKMIIPVLVAVLIGGTLFSSNCLANRLGAGGNFSAMSGAGRGQCGPDMAGGAQHMKMLSVALDFTDEQNTQVKQLVMAQREQMQPRRQALREGRRQLHEMKASPSFDEVAFRTLAQSVASQRIDLMVLRAQMRQKVFALMTPEQQQKAQKLKQVMQNKAKKGKGGRGMGGEV